MGFLMWQLAISPLGGALRFKLTENALYFIIVFKFCLLWGDLIDPFYCPSLVIISCFFLIFIFLFGF